ncbi:MAG TPA: acyl-CoA dehydrogenase family protein [Trebonia sp.]|nr:acyl-CoA dehydrogenase family protein [Trebonia sp.]
MSDRLNPLIAGLTAEETELVSAASSLVPVLSANAARADAARRLPDEDVTALREAGLLRLATPRAYGGHEAGACAVTAIAAELGRGCSSASWVLVVYYSASVALWLFPDEVRQLVWGQDPDATVCGSSAGAVPARPTDGGYLLSGRWGWASGAHHASWAILGIVAEADGRSPDRGVALVPMSELSVEETWHMAGMRGTGSDTIVGDSVFVPEERVMFLSRAAAAARPAGEARTPSSVPMPEGLMGALAAPLLGMGMSVYDHIVEKLTDGKPLVSGAKLHARAVDAPGVQANVADAAMLIDSAILQAARSARAIDLATRTGTRMTPLATARIRMDAGFAARQVRQAVDKLLDIGGASRFTESSPEQRIWRDLGTAMRHPAFVTEIDRERYARMLLGLTGH